MGIHDKYRGVRRFFNWLVEEGALGKSPLATVRAPRVPRKMVRPFGEEEVRRLLLVAGRGFCGLRNRAIILLLLDTGMRLRELSALRLWDLDFDWGVVRVIGRATQKALLRCLLFRSDPHPEVWVSEERRPLTYNSLNDAIRTVGKRAGIEFRSSAHTYRHTFATSTLKNGADLFRVQALLGHSSLEMVRRYAASLGSEHAVEGHRSFGPVDKLKL